jgi:serine-type D-Ala-D-Ala carboxypeptidase/endopeptidase (penicillin-binding protein 4)
MGLAALPAQADDLAGEIAAQIATFEKARLGQVGFSAVDLATGQPLAAHNAAAPMTPASNQKLLTLAFAADRLGPDGQFVTSLYRRGNRLMLTGDGDPLLGDPVLAGRAGRSIYTELDRWAAQAVKRLDAKAPADIVVLRTPSRYDPPVHPDWSKHDITRWYGAPVGELNFHDNCYDVTFLAQNKTIVPAISPASRFIRTANETRPGKKHLWRLVTTPDENRLTVKGTVRAASADPISSPMADPAMVLARVLGDRLVRAGQPVGRFGRADRTARSLAGAELLASTATPISAVMARAGKRSLNLAAEALLLRAGDGTWTGSAEAMTKYLLTARGLDAAGLVVRDGSGLSRQNRCSAGNFTTLLSAMVRTPQAGAYLAALPRSGKDGTLRRRLDSDLAEGRIIAKSGVLTGVVALSGYVLDEENRPRVAFSILVNRARPNWKAKRLADTLCRQLIRWVDAQPLSPAR